MHQLQRAIVYSITLTLLTCKPPQPPATTRVSNTQFANVNSALEALATRFANLEYQQDVNMESLTDSGFYLFSIRANFLVQALNFANTEIGSVLEPLQQQISENMLANFDGVSRSEVQPILDGIYPQLTRLETLVTKLEELNSEAASLIALNKNMGEGAYYQLTRRSRYLLQEEYDEFLASPDTAAHKYVEIDPSPRLFPASMDGGAAATVSVFQGFDRDVVDAMYTAQYVLQRANDTQGGPGWDEQLKDLFAGVNSRRETFFKEKLGPAVVSNIVTTLAVENLFRLIDAGGLGRITDVSQLDGLGDLPISDQTDCLSGFKLPLHLLTEYEDARRYLVGLNLDFDGKASGRISQENEQFSNDLLAAVCGARALSAPSGANLVGLGASGIHEETLEMLAGDPFWFAAGLTYGPELKVGEDAPYYGYFRQVYEDTINYTWKEFKAPMHHFWAFFYKEDLYSTLLGLVPGVGTIAGAAIDIAFTMHKINKVHNMATFRESIFLMTPEDDETRPAKRDAADVAHKAFELIKFEAVMVGAMNAVFIAIPVVGKLVISSAARAAVRKSISVLVSESLPNLIAAGPTTALENMSKKVVDDLRIKFPFLPADMDDMIVKSKMGAYFVSTLMDTVAYSYVKETKLSFMMVRNLLRESKDWTKEFAETFETHIKDTTLVGAGLSPAAATTNFLRKLLGLEHDQSLPPELNVCTI